MQQSYTSILLQILDIIHYPNNKEKFIDEFEKLNREEAILNILDRLPESLQEKLKNNPDEIKNYVHDDDEYMVELTKVSEGSLAKFIEDISRTLDTNQIEKITDLFPQIQES